VLQLFNSTKMRFLHIQRTITRIQAFPVNTVEWASSTMGLSPFLTASFQVDLG